MLEGYAGAPASGGSDASAPPRGTPDATPDVPLVYVGRNSLLLKGPVSRRIYPLRPGMAPVAVDARDVAPLLNSPLFTR